jgi:DNA-binding transcriptional ArsR family regulator
LIFEEFEALTMKRSRVASCLTIVLNTNMTKLDALSTTLAALADPTRRAILGRLAVGEATVNELAEPFDISLPAVSRHLKVLEIAGLISRGRDAQWRPCRLEAAALKDVDDWLERYRQFWTGSFDRMDDYIAKLRRNTEKRDGRNTRRR